jgi:hypothetical protein
MVFVFLRAIRPGYRSKLVSPRWLQSIRPTDLFLGKAYRDTTLTPPSRRDLRRPARGRCDPPTRPTTSPAAFATGPFADERILSAVRLLGDNRNERPGICPAVRAAWGRETGVASDRGGGHPFKGVRYHRGRPVTAPWQTGGVRGCWASSGPVEGGAVVFRYLDEPELKPSAPLHESSAVGRSVPHPGSRSIAAEAPEAAAGGAHTDQAKRDAPKEG